MSASIFRTIRVAPVARLSLTRTFVATPYHQKSVTDTVKDAAKAVDQTIAQGAIKGLEVGETVTEKAKEMVGSAPSADEVAGKAKGTYAEAKGTVAGKAHEAAGAAEGKKEEVKGKTGM